MLKFIVHIVITVALSLALFACKHEHPNQQGQYQSEEKTDYLTATLNGVQWESCSNNFWLLDTGAEIYDNEWFFVGRFFCTESENFELACESTLPLELGTYSLNGSETFGTVIFHYTNGFLDSFITDSNHTGELEITKIDSATKEISGTCSFECYCPELDSTITVTDCVYRVNYTDYR